MLISIIIPAYNCAESILRLLSILSKQIKDVSAEIIVVNDGSTDNTEDVLCSFAGSLPRFSFISVPNSGPAKARNTGMAAAHGEYIVFADADDYFADGALSFIAKTLTGLSPDLLVFGFDIVDEKGRKEKYRSEKAHFDKENFGKNAHILYSRNMLNQVWGKAFKKSIITENNICFSDYRWGEDRLFVFDYLSKASDILVTDECLYEYVQTKGSLVSSFYEDKFSVCKMTDERARAMSGKNISAEAGEVYDYMFTKSAVSCLTMLYNEKCPYSAAQKKEYTEKVINDERVISAKHYPKNAGTGYKAVRKILETKNAFSVMLCMRAVYFASEKMTAFFRRAKHKMNR